MHKTIHRLRFVSLAEGCSFLLLLGVAMPLRRFAGLPEAVTYAGWLHGLLFLGLCLLIVQALANGWRFARGATVLIAALVPLAPFLLDRHLQRWAAEATPR